jgi:hypothetical protein
MPIFRRDVAPPRNVESSESFLHSFPGSIKHCCVWRCHEFRYGTTHILFNKTLVCILNAKEFPPAKRTFTWDLRQPQHRQQCEETGVCARKLGANPRMWHSFPLLDGYLRSSACGALLNSFE